MKVMTDPNREGGQMLVLFVLLLAVVLGFTALVIDVGLVYVERRNLQSAADAAALAAAQELPGTPSLLTDSARQWAAKNGYDIPSGATVSVTTPYNGDPSKVEVVISKDVSAVFARVLGKEVFAARARAVATRGVKEVRGIAILALNPSACNAFYKNGSGQLSVSDGGAIAVNSTCSTAISVGGPGGVTAGGFYYYPPGGWSGNVSPTPEPMTAPVSDPLSTLVPPDIALTAQSPNSAGTPTAPALLRLNTGTTVLNPGVYYGGIAIASNANVTFQPGIYIMAGGGFSVTGNGAVTGDGIMIYNTYDPQYNKNAGACASISFGGGTNVKFTAMTSGRYANILFWQDKACTNPFSLAGNGALGTGVFYVPTAEFRITGTADAGAKQIIASTVNTNGNANVIIDFDPYLSSLAGPLRLVE